MTTSDGTGRDLAIDENWSTIWDRIAAALGERPAIVTPARTLSYAELEERASRLAATLAAHGVTSGSKVGIFLYNRAEYLETIYAAFKLGAVPVNMNFRYRSEELASLIRICSASALVFPASLAGGWLYFRQPALAFYVAGAVGIAGCLVYAAWGKSERVISGA